MTDAEIHWRDDRSGQVISRSSRPSEQTLSLLRETVWGSRDTRYRVLGIGEKLSRLRDPSFFVLSENGTELCVFVLDHCQKSIKGQVCGAYHFVMAATRPDRRDLGLATRMIDVIRPYAEKTVGRPGLGFAYVEETTEISLKISEHAGHSVESDISLQLFSRLIPARDDRAGAIRDTEHRVVLRGLEQLYSDHELADFEASFRPEETRVIRRDGQAIASVQVEPLNWEVVSMPGFRGRLLLDVLPHVPGWNRLLDLRNLKVLRFGNVFFRQGEAAEFFALAESCLAENHARIGLVMLDRNSSVLHSLRQSGDFGLLSRAMRGNAKLHVDTIFMDDALVERLKATPLLVSPADVF